MEIYPIRWLGTLGCRRIIIRLLAFGFSCDLGCGVPVLQVSYSLDADGQRMGRRELVVETTRGAMVTNTSRFWVEVNPANGLGQRWAELTEGRLDLFLMGRKPIAKVSLSPSGEREVDYWIGDAMSPSRSDERRGEPGVDMFDAYGNRMAPSELGTRREDPGYLAEFQDVATGLYDLRARSYDPESGRFTTLDPYEGDLRAPASRHRYLYAHADPINHLDPSGLVVKHAARDLDGMAWGTHQFLILVPDHPEDFVGSGKGASLMREMGIDFRLIGGRMALTAGGHSVGGQLTVRWLERADEMAAIELLDRSYSMPFYKSDFDVEAHDIPPPPGQGDTEFILRVLKAVQHYRSNQAQIPIQYPPFGGGLTPWSRRQLNSNAWVSSLLEAVGARPWPDFSGYDPLRRNRIPAWYFNVAPRPDLRPAGPTGPGGSSVGLSVPSLLLP